MEVENVKHTIKASLLVITALVITFSTILINPRGASANTFDVDAKAAILVDAETGKILYGKNYDTMLGIASMTKMMTEYLVLEAIEEGQISWDTTTQISDYPYSISANPSFSGIGLIQNKPYTVEQLYEGMSIISDNATTIALAELIAGSEGEFVKMMNDKAEELGLPDYDFANSTGLNNSSLGENYPDGTDPDAETMLSARSVAMLAYHLVNDFPKALEFSSTLTSELDGQPLTNLNWMLPWQDVSQNFAQYYAEGVDGLKTGYTDLAGYSFTGTAQRNGKRLISVVMDVNVDGITHREAKMGKRFEETKKLLDYGYSQFEEQELFEAGYQIEGESVLPVAKGKEEEVEIESKEAITEVIKIGDQENYQVTYKIDEDKMNEDGELIAPLEKGEKIGTMELAYSGNSDFGYLFDKEQVKSVDVVTSSAVEKQNWFMLMLGSIGDFFSNLGKTIKGWF